MALAAYTVITDPGAYVSGTYYRNGSTLYLEDAEAKYPLYYGSVSRLSGANPATPDPVTTNATVSVTVGSQARTITLAELISILNQPQASKAYVDGLFTALLAGSAPSRQTLKALSDLIDSLATEFTGHLDDTGNPHQTTAAQVGLGQVANLAPGDMPVSSAQAAAIARGAQNGNTDTDGGSF